MQLAIAAHRIAGIFHRVQAERKKVTPDVRVGEHCRYCPAQAACPSTNALARHMLGTPDIEAITAQLTVEQVGEAWAKLAYAKAFVDGLERALSQGGR
jgi:hypothetical protein